MMNRHQYARALEYLGLSQRAGARFLGVDERTSRRWIAGDSEIPTHVGKLLCLMINLKLSAADVDDHVVACFRKALRDVNKS